MPLPIALVPAPMEVGCFNPLRAGALISFLDASVLEATGWLVTWCTSNVSSSSSSSTSRS